MSDRALAVGTGLHAGLLLSFSIKPRTSDAIGQRISRCTGTDAKPGYSAWMEILTNSVSSVGAETITGDSSWQQQMKLAVRDLGALREMLQLPEDLAAQSSEASFSVFAPLPFIDRIEPGNPSDPLLLQLLPRQLEDTSPSHYTTDPLAESEAQLGPGVLKKYTGRALFIVTGACAIHCRYCFRRHFPYQDHSVIGGDWESAIASIAEDESIEEVIFSGGDPLTVVDARLASLISRVGARSACPPITNSHSLADYDSGTCDEGTGRDAKADEFGSRLGYSRQSRQ